MELPRAGRRVRSRFLLDGGGREPPLRGPWAETERRRQRAEVRPQLDAKADEGDLGAERRADGGDGGLTSGEESRKQADRRVRLRAPPAGDQAARRRDPRVGAVAGETAAAFRVERAALQSCGEPALLANVLLAGKPGVEPNLHQPQPARRLPWRALYFEAEPHARRAPRSVTRSQAVGKFPAGAITALDQRL